MIKYFRKTVLLAVNMLVIACLFGCGFNKTEESQHAEDQHSKQQLQGVWISDVDGDVVFSFKGDSVFYNDSLSTPSTFYVMNDTLFIENHKLVSYPIRKLTSSTILFVNSDGDEVELTKSSSKNNLRTGEYKGAVSLNQGKTVKKDTVLVSDGNHFHAYTQVNPTTYKVYRQTTNDDGLQVENIYYDNIVHVALYVGQQKVFGQNFTKKDFLNIVPKTYLEQAVLSDIFVESAKDGGVRFVAVLTIPDSYTNYRVNIDISATGTKKLSV